MNFYIMYIHNFIKFLVLVVNSKLFPPQIRFCFDTVFNLFSNKLNAHKK